MSRDLKRRSLLSVLGAAAVAGCSSTENSPADEGSDETPQNQSDNTNDSEDDAETDTDDTDEPMQQACPEPPAESIDIGNTLPGQINGTALFAVTYGGANVPGVDEIALATPSVSGDEYTLEAYRVASNEAAAHLAQFFETANESSLYLIDGDLGYGEPGQNTPEAFVVAASNGQYVWSVYGPNEATARDVLLEVSYLNEACL